MARAGQMCMARGDIGVIGPVRTVAPVLDVYVVKVRRDPDTPGLVAGTLEAVATGEQRLFRDGTELLAALVWGPPAVVQAPTAMIIKEGSSD
jgi:hypothetical protein